MNTEVFDVCVKKLMFFAYIIEKIAVIIKLVIYCKVIFFFLEIYFLNHPFHTSVSVIQD